MAADVEFKDKRITVIASEATKSSDSAVPRVLIKLQEILDSYGRGSEDLVLAKALLWRYELPQVMLVALKQDFNKVVDGWNVAAKLSSIVVSCCTGYSSAESDLKDFRGSYLVDLTLSLLVLGGKMQKKYIKISLVLEDTKKQMLANYKTVMESVGILLSTYDHLPKIAVESAAFLQMLLTDDHQTSHRAMLILQNVNSLNRGFHGTLDAKIGNQILDELIFKLTASTDQDVASIASRTLLCICESHPPAVQLILSRYKGLKMLLKKWTSRGSTKDLMLLLDVGNLQTARLAKDARAAMIIQAWWRSYQTRRKLKQANAAMSRLQLTYRNRKTGEEKRRLEEKMRGDLEHMLVLQRKYNMRQLHIRQLHELEILPASAVNKHLAEEQNRAAALIQSRWKGFRGRSGIDRKREEVKRVKAAILIQRGVRRWLDRQQARREESTVSWKQPIGLTDERRMELQAQIDQWRERREKPLPSREGQVELYRRAQDLIRQRVLGIRDNQERSRHIDSLLGRLDMDSNLLINMPKLSEMTEADLRGGAFNCHSLPLAMKAKDNHSEELKLQREPWWRKLKDEPQADNLTDLKYFTKLSPCGADEHIYRDMDRLDDTWKVF